MTSAPRLRMKKLMPLAYQALSDWHIVVSRTGAEAGLEPLLVELVKVRASQLNRCAFCLDMHVHEARELGERQARLDVVAAWHECGELFSRRERAALELTEAMTRLPEAGVPDDLYNRVAQVFTHEQIAALVMAIAVINAWNRLGVASGAMPPHRP
ncbi:alkyl hydroperoxide reductase AhpD [Rhizocola hellebori]|uniref:Alkyl hydroperoxide reductase AhpD n=1 Tax=Rhizocola hellebori TaxID=1392758 RepID=A0A8J3VGA7_9ACTN|nr:carboxymuconolactone decarboxylase family protein [Rhizocola hellebori]GIH04678.1 alkyl hydroperoxide reductase AhpD [Rhizocola hellebori]